MFSLASLFKGKFNKGNSKAVVKDGKLFISSGEKPFYSAVEIPENYNVSLFSVRKNSGNINRNNLKALNSCYDDKHLQDDQKDELAMLSMSTRNMLVHSALVHKDETHLSFVTKTSKEDSFYYMLDGSEHIKKSGVSDYSLENGEICHISAIVYRTRLTVAPDNLFWDLQNNKVKLAYFQYTTSNVESMIASYNKLTSIVYVDKLVEPGFHIHYHLYDKVHSNYIKGLITKKQFGMFLDWFNAELKRLNIKQYNHWNNFNNLYE